MLLIVIHLGTKYDIYGFNTLKAKIIWTKFTQWFQYENRFRYDIFWYRNKPEHIICKFNKKELKNLERLLNNSHFRNVFKLAFGWILVDIKNTPFLHKHAQKIHTRDIIWLKFTWMPRTIITEQDCVNKISKTQLCNRQ